MRGSRSAVCGFQEVESSADFTGGWTWSPESWSGFAPGDVQTVAVTYAPTELSTGDELVLHLESSVDRGSYVIVEATGTAF